MMFYLSYSLKKNLEKSSTICYNRSTLKELRPTLKPNTNPTFSQNFNSSNSRKTRTCTSRRIQTLREENHCHFCGEIGHIKR